MSDSSNKILVPEYFWPDGEEEWWNRVCTRIDFWTFGWIFSNVRAFVNLIEDCGKLRNSRICGHLEPAGKRLENFRMTNEFYLLSNGFIETSKRKSCISFHKISWNVWWNWRKPSRKHSRIALVAEKLVKFLIFKANPVQNAFLVVIINRFRKCASACTEQAMEESSCRWLLRRAGWHLLEM